MTNDKKKLLSLHEKPFSSNLANCSALPMQKETIISEIRGLLSDARTEEALQKTREWLQTSEQESALVQLDLIESEWNDVRVKTMNGLLNVDDQLRLDNISKAKLLELLLHLDGKQALTKNLQVTERPAPESAGENVVNSLSNGFKNGVGVLLFMAAGGSVLTQKWIDVASFGIAGFFLFVPTLKFLEKSIGYRFLSWQKYAIVLASLFLVGYFAPKRGNDAATGTKTEIPK